MRKVSRSVARTGITRQTSASLGECSQMSGVEVPWSHACFADQQGKWWVLFLA